MYVTRWQCVLVIYCFKGASAPLVPATVAAGGVVEQEPRNNLSRWLENWLSIRIIIRHPTRETREIKSPVQAARQPVSQSVRFTTYRGIGWLCSFRYLLLLHPLLSVLRPQAICHSILNPISWQVDPICEFVCLNNIYPPFIRMSSIGAYRMVRISSRTRRLRNK